jgi:hypothetical protein
MNERQFGNKVRQALNQGLEVSPRVAQRLKAAREAALERQRVETAPALAWADNVVGRAGGWGRLVLYIVVPLAFVLVGFAGAYTWQQNRIVAELEEIDAQLLTDDLPIDAYLDRGFQSWLKKRAAEH